MEEPNKEWEPGNFTHLRNILSVLIRANFPMLSGKPEGKLTFWDYQVLSVDYLLSKCHQNGYGIAFHNGLFYVYDKTYWVKTQEPVMKYFLVNVSERIGLDYLLGTHYNFIEHFYEQLKLKAIAPGISGEQEGIKINVSNGTLHLVENQYELRPHCPKDFLTYKLKFDYNPDAVPALFLETLDTVLPEKESQMVLSEFIATSFIPRNIHNSETAIYAKGPGGNGKSLIASCIIGLLSTENVSTFSLDQLTGDVEYHRANAADKLINYSTEAGAIKNLPLLKQLISQETISVRRPYQEPFVITNFPKLIINANDYPKETEISNAFFRRFIVIPFDVIISPEKQDKNLAQKIIGNPQELSGILNWIFEGMQRIMRTKMFTQSKVINQAQEEYKLQMDNVRMFLKDRFYAPSEDSWSLVQDIYNDYRAYVVECGFKQLNKVNFTKRLIAAGYHVNRRRNGRGVFIKRDAYDQEYMDNRESEKEPPF